MTAAEWLRRLLDATTVPPRTDDVEVLLTAFTTMACDRQAVFDHPGRPTGLGAEHAAVVAEIQRRHDAWQNALIEARTRVGGHRQAASQVRRYQRAA